MGVKQRKTKETMQEIRRIVKQRKTKETMQEIRKSKGAEGKILDVRRIKMPKSQRKVSKETKIKNQEKRKNKGKAKIENQVKLEIGRIKSQPNQRRKEAKI